MIRALCLALALACAAPAAAQPLADPEANVVEELVVVARDKGPAWWRVSDDDTTVYILGLPETALPPGLAWDVTPLQRRLRGSNALVGGSRAYTLGLRDIGLLLKLRRDLRQKGGMEDDLPAPLRARFVAGRERLGKDAKHYAGWGPLVAGQILVRDAREGPRWSEAEPQVRRLARKLKVREVRAKPRQAAPVLREVRVGLTDDVQLTCLDAALDDVEAGPAAAAAAARAWAQGDVPGALKAPRGFEKCLLALAGGSQVWSQAVQDDATEIAEALKAPGKAVAMVRLRRLLARGGVVETLEQMGYEVDGPNER